MQDIGLRSNSKPRLPTVHDGEQQINIWTRDPLSYERESRRFSEKVHCKIPTSAKVALTAASRRKWIVRLLHEQAHGAGDLSDNPGRMEKEMCSIHCTIFHIVTKKKKTSWHRYLGNLSVGCTIISNTNMVSYAQVREKEPEMRTDAVNKASSQQLYVTFSSSRSRLHL